MGTDFEADNGPRRWWIGRLCWALVLLVQLIIYALCTTIAWTAHDLSWIIWVAASVSLPMLVMRRILPPSLLTASPGLLLVVSIALTLAGWLVFSQFTDLLGNTVFVALGAFSLGFAIWLTMLGIQGVGAAAPSSAGMSSHDGRLLAEVLRRPLVWLALALSALVSAGVFYVASIWPLSVAAALDSSQGSDAVLAMICFWLGGAVGGVPALSRWEPGWLRPLVPILLLFMAAGMGAALPLWPALLAWLPPLLLGYVWVRVLREAGGMLGAELSRSLTSRVPSWLLGWAGGGALVAGLLAFALLREKQADSWEAWLRAALPAVVLLLAGAVVAWLLRGAPRARLGAEADAASACWFAFPGLELRQPRPVRDDAVVVEIAYDVPDKNLASFFHAMANMERVRFEEGAAWWTLTRDEAHATVYHEFYRLESWTEYQQAIKEEGAAAREVKQQVFSANDWETMPAEIHYPVLGFESAMAALEEITPVSGTPQTTVPDGDLA